MASLSTLYFSTLVWPPPSCRSSWSESNLSLSSLRRCFSRVFLRILRLILSWLVGGLGGPLPPPLLLLCCECWDWCEEEGVEEAEERVEGV